MKLPPDERLQADLAAALEAIGEEPAPSILASLCAHLRLLAAWNARFHLTTITAWPEVLDRHVKESLLPLRWIGQTGRLIDIGSGNGYPAIPILACRPGLEGLLVERSEKKSLFLAEALRAAGLGRVRVVTSDLGGPEAAGPLGRSDYVLSRATLAPDEYLALAASLVSPGGRVFVYAAAAELRGAIDLLRKSGPGAPRGRPVSPEDGPPTPARSRSVPEPGRHGHPAKQTKGISLRLLEEVPIPGRRDSRLFVLQA